MNSAALGRAYVYDFITSDVYKVVTNDKDLHHELVARMREKSFEGPYEREQTTAERAETLEDSVREKGRESSDIGSFARSLVDEILDWTDWPKLVEMLDPDFTWPEG